jgi:hypothetical protein
MMGRRFLVTQVRETEGRPRGGVNDDSIDLARW